MYSRFIMIMSLRGASSNLVIANQTFVLTLFPSHF